MRGIGKIGKIGCGEKGDIGNGGLPSSGIRKLRAVWLSLPLRGIYDASHFAIRYAPT